MVALISGLGGARGFGENVLGRNDDGSTDLIDITPVFESGLNFFGTVYDGLFLNNNGSVTFEAPRRAFTPDVITGASDNPEITPYFGDVDTRDFTLGDEEPASLFPDAGNSTGSNLVWYDIDTAADRLIFTWDDVGYFSQATDKRNAFQLILTDRGGSDFDIEFRYEDIRWTTGDASGGTDGLGGEVARAGYTAGTGREGEFFELPQSGNQQQMLLLDAVPGNTGAEGQWLFSVRGGAVVESGVPTAPTVSKTGVSIGDPHIFTYDGTAYDFMAVGEYVLTREVGVANGIEVHARQVPVAGSDTVSVNAAVATRLGQAVVMIDATDPVPVQVDGAGVEIADFSTLAVGNGLIGREGDRYTIVYPGADGEVNAGDDRMEVRVIGDRVDVEVTIDASGPRDFEGILGDCDPAGPDARRDDIAFADGTALAQPLQAEQLYGRFRDDWRIDNVAESLLFYEAGESPNGFYDPSFPAQRLTVADLPLADREAAEQVAVDAGLVPGTANFNNAVLDFALTGDPSFIDSALSVREIDEDASVDGTLSVNQARVVAYLYEAALDRDGNIDTPGLNFWIDQRERGLTTEQLANAFLVSDEFTNRFGAIDSLTDEQLVDALFQNVLNRPADEGGRNFWLGVLDRVGERGELLLTFAESAENATGSPGVATLNQVEEGTWDFVA